jgi:hypothetical protein
MPMVAAIDPTSRTGPNLLWTYTRLALRNPRLIPPLLAAGWRFRRRDWYRKPPFLPIPTQAYVEWRMYTAYGSEGAPTAADFERYLRWTHWMNRTATKE